jgi:hypothetical protein
VGIWFSSDALLLYNLTGLLDFLRCSLYQDLYGSFIERGDLEVQGRSKSPMRLAAVSKFRVSTSAPVETLDGSRRRHYPSECRRDGSDAMPGGEASALAATASFVLAEIIGRLHEL